METGASVADLASTRPAEAIFADAKNPSRPWAHARSQQACRFGGGAAAGSPSAAPNGIAAFTRHNRFVDAKISPKGTYLAGISTEGGKRWLSIVDLANRKLASTFRPNPESVGEFYWANDSRVVVQLWNASDGTLASPVTYGQIYAGD